MYIYEIEMDIRRGGGGRPCQEGTDRPPAERAPSRLSLLLWIRRIRHGRKEAERVGGDRGWPNAEKCCLLVVSSKSQHDTAGLRLPSSAEMVDIYDQLHPTSGVMCE